MKSILITSLFLFTAFIANAQQDSTQIDYYKNTRPSGDIPTDQATVMKGKELFEAQCSRCHELGHQKIGPALASVTDRRPVAWLMAWIRDSDAVLESGDEYANFLFANYNNYNMPAFEFLSEQDKMSILAYIQNESGAETHVSGVSSGKN